MAAILTQNYQHHVYYVMYYNGLSPLWQLMLHIAVMLI
jgi:hypothetical protein